MENSEQQGQVNDQPQDRAPELNGYSGDAFEDSVKRAQDGARADVVKRLLCLVRLDYPENGPIHSVKKLWCNGCIQTKAP